MSAKIKLQRVGTKNQPSYRVVVQDEARPTVARVVAILGTYFPLKEPTEFAVNKELTLDWIRKGAKPTEKVRILLGKAGILPPIDLAALPKRKKKGAAAEAPAAEAPAAAAPAAPKEEAPAA
jgi:small subunit ribosomal protein S16